jgi:hypothetical protein
MRTAFDESFRRISTNSPPRSDELTMLWDGYSTRCGAFGSCSRFFGASSTPLAVRKVEPPQLPVFKTLH